MALEIRPLSATLSSDKDVITKAVPFYLFRTPIALFILDHNSKRLLLANKEARTLLGVILSHLNPPRASSE